MSNYLLFLILMTLCLGGVPLDGRVKQILYVVFALLGVLAFLGSGFIPVK